VNMNRFQYFFAISMVLIAGALLVGCDSTNPQEPPHARWQWANSPTAVTLHGSFRSAANDIWAVGDLGNIIHYDGTAWELQPNDNLEDLFAIAMIDPTQGFVVGDGGFVAAYANGSWSPIRTPSRSNLRSIAFVDPSEGWIVGEEGTILHIVSGNMEQEMCPVQTNLNCVGVTGASGKAEAWAMGDDGVILKRMDGVWTQYVSPTDSDINCMYLDAAGIGWAGADKGVVLRFKDGVWGCMNSPVNEDITAVWGLGINKAWIGDRIGETYLRSGEGWAGWENFLSPPDNTIHAFAFNSATNGWGFCTAGGIIRLQ
jgi:photosystem II stability/assembly factor-like uncharacterized protein